MGIREVSVQIKSVRLCAWEFVSDLSLWCNQVEIFDLGICVENFKDFTQIK